MRAVFVADSPAQAHLVSGLLEESGIRNVVEGEMLFGVRAEIGMTPASLPKVNVNDEDFERARAVIEGRDLPSSLSIDPAPAVAVDGRRRRFEFVVLGAWGVALVLGASMLVVGGLMVLPFVVLAIAVLILGSLLARRS